MKLHFVRKSGLRTHPSELFLYIYIKVGLSMDTCAYPPPSQGKINRNLWRRWGRDGSILLNGD
ncbi:uncharacterized protein DS421_11g325630 [Arachis hypogaea]|nr:uncharacterized protein DS421_11g325630 [Arachis hypogaea]